MNLPDFLRSAVHFSASIGPYICVGSLLILLAVLKREKTALNTTTAPPPNSDPNPPISIVNPSAGVVGHAGNVFFGNSEPVYDPSSALEIIDKLILKGRNLVETCLDMTSELPDGEPDNWFEETKFNLSKYAPSYLLKFVEASDALSPVLPHLSDSEPIDWDSLPKRQEFWNGIHANLDSLKEIRTMIRNTLPK